MERKTLLTISLALLLSTAGSFAAENRIVNGVTFSDTIQVVDSYLGEIPLLRVVRGSEDFQLFELQEGYPVVNDIVAELLYYATYGTRAGREGALVASELLLADGIPPEDVWPGATSRGEYRDWLESRRLDSRDWHYQVAGDYRIAIVAVATYDMTGWYGFNVNDVVPVFNEALFGQTIDVTNPVIDGETNELSVRDHFAFAGQNGNGGINVIPDDLRGEYNPEHPGWITEGWNGNVPFPLLLPVTEAELDNYTTEGILQLISPRIEELGFSTETDTYNVFMLLWGVSAAHADAWSMPVGVQESHLSANIWSYHQLLSSGEICRMIFGTLGYGELDPLTNTVGRAHLLCEGWQGPPSDDEYTYWQPAWVDPYIEQCLGWWEPELIEVGEELTVNFNAEDRLILPDPRDPDRMRTVSCFDHSENFYKGHRADACSYFCDITVNSWNHELSVQSIPAVHPDEEDNYAFPWHGVDSLDFQEWEEGRNHPHRIEQITQTPGGGEMEILWQGMPPLGLLLQECTIDLAGTVKTRLWNYGYNEGDFVVVIEIDDLQEAGSATLAGGETGDCLIPNLPSATFSELGSTLACLITVTTAGQDTVLHQQASLGRTLAPTSVASTHVAYEQLFSCDRGSVLWKWNMFSVVWDGVEVLHDYTIHNGLIEDAWISETESTLLLHTENHNWDYNFWDLIDIETGAVSQVSYPYLGPLAFEMGEEVIFFVESVNGNGESWILHHNLLDGSQGFESLIPFIPEQGCVLPNEQLPLMALTFEDNLLICNHAGTILLDWQDPYGETLGQPLAADLNWDGWYDLLLPIADGWYIFAFDISTMSFGEYYHSQPGLVQESVIPIYNGQQVVVGSIAEDFIRIGADQLPLPSEGLTALHSADLNDDGIYEYLVSGAGQGVALLQADGQPFYGEYLPWLIQDIGQTDQVHFHSRSGHDTEVIIRNGNELTSYSMMSDFPILWNGRSNCGNSYTHPLTAAVPQPPPHMNLELHWTSSDQPALTFNPDPGGHVLNGFKVYRSTNPYDFSSEPLVELGPCNDLWIDTDPPAGNCYYRVSMLLDDPQGLICPNQD